MAIFIFFSVQTCQNQKDTIQTLEHRSDSAFNSIRYYQDKNKRLQAQVNTQEVTLQNFKRYWSEDSKRLKAQIGNLNNLVGFWRGKASFSDTALIPLRDSTALDPHSLMSGWDSIHLVNESDTLFDTGHEITLPESNLSTHKRFNWSNGHLTLSGEIDLKSNVLALDYQYQVNFELTSYYKKSGFLKKQLVADIYFSDPNLRVQEFQAIMIKPKERFYQKTWFQIWLGAVGGLWLGSKL
jgi:hypothetical protein